VPLALASWRSTRAIPPSRARPIEQLALHKRHVDLYLLAFGVLLVWQLNRSGSFLARALGGSPLAPGRWVDPLLLLGPFLLLVAIALVFLRLVPFLSRLAARPSQRRRGLVLPLGLLRPARDPRQPSRLVLLVSLAVGLALFGWVLGHSLHQGQGGLGSDLLEQGAASLCQFNALGLVLFGALSFFLAQFAAVQSRSREVGVLRAMGLPARQRPAPYLVESILVLSLALVAGAVLGLALSLTLVPYLSQMLLAVVGAGVTTEAVGLDWQAIARLLVALVAVYALALALLWLALAWRPVQRWPGVDGE
jgi:hypothetical protein